MKNKVFIGVDPGFSGGVAILKNDDIETINMPEEFTDIYEMFLEIKEKYSNDELIAVMENVGHGIPGQSSKATASFARHNGHIEMALYALHIRTVKVTPQKWQKYFSNSIGSAPGENERKEKKEWKNKLKSLARQMYPDAKATLYTADAILLADYGKHMVM